MAKIDLTHNSAPLRGAMRPSLEEVNALLRQDPLLVWDCPDKTGAAPADLKMFWVRILFLAALFSMGVGGFFFFSYTSAHPSGSGRPASAGQQQAAGEGIVPMSSAKHSLYVVLRKPNPEFVAYLAQLAQKGVTVRMVTAESVPAQTGITISTVAAELIPSNGVLIDGTTWYTIGHDSHVK